LNKKYIDKCPLDIPAFTGNYGDLLFLTLQKTMIKDKGIVRPLFDCYLTIMCNVSPYLKQLSMMTSIKLVSLFEILSLPKYLYTTDRHSAYVNLMLQILNNLIQYQYEGNIHVVYSILRKKKIFLELLKTPDLDKIKENIEKKKNKSNLPVFIPTKEWVDSWKNNLPTKTIVTMIKILVPDIEQMCEGKIADEDDVINYLRRITLVGLLPVPHTIVLRTFSSNPQIISFLKTFIWGIIYLKNLDPPMFDSSTIKLFKVNVINEE